MSAKVIFHLDIDAFFDSVEEIKKPSYKNKPLIIGGRTRNSIVSTCNYAHENMGLNRQCQSFKQKYYAPKLLF